MTDRSEITVTDIINIHLTKIGIMLVRSKVMNNSWGVRSLPNGDFEIVYLDDNL